MKKIVYMGVNTINPASEGFFHRISEIILTAQMKVRSKSTIAIKIEALGVFNFKKS